MRYFLLAASAALLPQASAAEPAGHQSGPILSPAAEMPRLPADGRCRKPTNYKADADSVWQGDGLKPRNLTELPSARGYMAVYRTVNGCEEPMTVAEYRLWRN